MDLAPGVILNDGRAMPQLGLGVWQIPEDRTAEVVRIAVAAGYRSIDTATVYGNEAGVGEGVKTACVPREEIFVTTKLANKDHNGGYDETLRAFDHSLARMGLDDVDLYLIHWPQPVFGKYANCWRALVRLRDEGRAKSIGVCNFYPEHLERVIGETGVTPAVNQIELHPLFQQSAARAFHPTLGVVTESWSPLGRGALLENPVIGAIAARHGKTAAQVVLRWHIELGLVAIPRSGNAGRIAENIDIFDFSLDAADIAAIARLDDPAGRVGPDPMVINQA